MKKELNKQIEMYVDAGVSKEILIIKGHVSSMTINNYAEVLHKVNDLVTKNGIHNDVLIVLLNATPIDRTDKYTLSCFKSVILGYLDNIINSAVPTLRCSFCKNVVYENKCTGCNHEF